MYAVVGDIPRERSQWLSFPGLAQNAPYSLLVLVNPEPITGKTELRGHAVKRHCPLLAECPFAAENSNAFHQQLGKAPLDITSEVTGVGCTFRMVSVVWRDVHFTLLSTAVETSL